MGSSRLNTGGARLIRIEIKYAGIGIDSVKGMFDFPDSLYPKINSFSIPIDSMMTPRGVDWNDIIQRLTDLANHPSNGTWRDR